ncbi:putative cyclin-dependent kinase, regulatory subunit [Helianthus annuus]|uniref:Cyclin-dependent kinases regulatory subunit n=1 Tax=Helianthus annuus TaxID=4232 RepID=A0A9K3ILN7_HELAN|nr:putative cyclin-dependent kinase, regulatory subunit [Helianthus annuus]KAJ0550284.1 putative cyclin-dependent kinase, regulatory subunit [Helianthus annuus]KAJ0556961.1 putative cyclin-dependent kinase, regulatory subunit [Helianthus annuus]KAJ0563238.1 putative cyclin-dependent kinase, regulatory subunit [Helianthus annuus]KAJ0728593.1 putative cyclin-dependent kinase, regulatory subunit [Helianthus annuus]
MGQIQYSEKYFDDTFEYRHVVLPPEVAKLLPKNRLLDEQAWMSLIVANEQLEKVRTELDNKFFHTTTLGM